MKTIKFLFRAAVILSAFATLFAVSAFGVPGDLIKNVPLPVRGFGVSVAVDCDGNIYYTLSPGTTLHKMDKNGILISSTPIRNAGGSPIDIDEFAWDNNLKVLWGGQHGSNPVNVWTVDRATGLATFQFVSRTISIGTFRDGLAFEGTDNTLWLSGDVSTTIEHYQTNGAFINQITPKNAAGGNLGLISGVIVGVGDLLYLGQNGLVKIVKVKKSNGDFISDFASPGGGRDEGLECDPVNFAPLLALWSRDVNNFMSVIEIEPGTCGCGGAPPQPRSCIDTLLCRPDTICFPFHFADPNGANGGRLSLTGSGGGPVLVSARFDTTVCVRIDTAGFYQLFVVVTDSCGAVAADTVCIRARFDRPPFVHSNDTIIFLCDTATICRPVFSGDPDDNLVSVTCDGVPVALGVGEFCFKADTAGIYRFICKATDACDSMAVDTQFVTVLLNRPPFVRSNDTAIFLCRPDDICRPVFSSDPDGNLAAVFCDGVPVEPGIGQFCFAADTSGTYRFICTAIDRCELIAVDTQYVRVRLNRPPTVVSNDTTIFLCQPGEICRPVFSSDPDGNLAAVTCDGVPVALGLGSFCFFADHSGDYFFECIAVDSCGAQSQVDLQLVRVLLNRPPTVVSNDTTIDTCGFICRPIFSNDPDGNLATVLCNGVPIAPGVGAFCFRADTAGVYTFTCIAVDSCGAQAVDHQLVRVLDCRRECRPFIPPPVITSIVDVGNDEGYQVRVTWCRSLFDAPAGTIVEYDIYRRIDPVPGPASAAHPNARSGADFPPGQWDFIVTTPAVDEDVYNAVVPTLENCGALNPPPDCFSTFFVLAADHMRTTLIPSAPASGFSIDNLPPPAPTALAAKPKDGKVDLDWKPVPNRDLLEYQVYRDTSESFGTSLLLGKTASTTFQDASPLLGKPLFYQVTAVDSAGNEGPPSNLATAAIGKKGDLNLDGLLTAADVFQLLNCVYLGLGDCQLVTADANCDGVLTSADIIIELNAVFLNMPFPCQ